MQPIALVPRGVDISSAELSLVASAIQIQLIRDVSPVWSINAICSPYPSAEVVPEGYWFVFIVPDAEGSAGLHSGRQHPELPPFSVVQYKSGADWSKAASHEIIEMLIDPRGGRFIEGPDPMSPGGKADYLVEPCDPCQDAKFCYQIDHRHSVWLSDFCLPSFYGQGNGGPPYSYRQSIAMPFSVASGGYLSWRAESGNWFQLRALGGPTRIIPVKEGDVMRAEEGQEGNFRGAMDRSEKGYTGPGLGEGLKLIRRKYTNIRRSAEETVKRRNALVTQCLEKLGL